MTNEQGKFWLLTIPHHLFMPWLPPGVKFIKGQLERGESTGYLHWQVLVCFIKRVRRRTVKSIFGEQLHVEYVKSRAAHEYVWKESTAITGTRFLLGELPADRSSSRDWDTIWQSARDGKFEEIPADVRLRYYSQVKRVYQDHLQPLGFEKEVQVFWGPTGVGKSRMAWEQAGLQAYPKGISP